RPGFKTPLPDFRPPRLLPRARVCPSQPTFAITCCATRLRRDGCLSPTWFGCCARGLSRLALVTDRKRDFGPKMLIMETCQGEPRAEAWPQPNTEGRTARGLRNSFILLTQTVDNDTGECTPR